MTSNLNNKKLKEFREIKVSFISSYIVKSVHSLISQNVS